MSNKLEKKKKSEVSEKQRQTEADFEILKAVNTSNPKEADKKAFYEMVERRPEMYEAMYSLQMKTESDILNQQCSFLMGEKTKRELKNLRDGLGYETASELEKILIEQICVNHLRVHLLEAAHAQKTFQSHTTETGLYWDKRLSSAQGRYLRACETLAKVRRLLAEADLRDRQARKLRGESALIAQKVLKNSTS